MNTMKNIAACPDGITTSGRLGFKPATRGAVPLALLLVLALAGCSSLPSPPTRPVLYDFGPGVLAAPAPGDASAALPPLSLADVEAPGLPEGSNAVLYRLLYADSQQLRPYAHARWSQPPAQLVQQRLREQLGQRRPILRADDGSAQVRGPGAGRLPPVLRVDLEEFSQVFTSATESAGVVRLRATVVDLTPAGEVLRGQRVLVVRTPARTADAPGGVAALAESTTQAAQELVAWMAQLP